jgi:hypothetical protein
VDNPIRPGIDHDPESGLMAHFISDRSHRVSKILILSGQIASEQFEQAEIHDIQLSQAHNTGAIYLRFHKLESPYQFAGHAPM